MAMDARWGELVASYEGTTHVRPPSPGARRGFGSASLTVGSKIFAMFVEERLVVKLPRERVESLTEAGEGIQLAIGTRTMLEWLALDPQSTLDWRSLADEALDYVG